MADVNYTPIGWEDAPSQDTPINAANLGHMEDGISDATTRANGSVEKENVLTSESDAKSVTELGYIVDATVLKKAISQTYIEITTTLITGETTVTITNDAITSDSVLDIYAKDALLGLESAPTISGHTVTITFDETQETDVQVKVRVS